MPGSEVLSLDVGLLCENESWKQKSNTRKPIILWRNNIENGLNGFKTNTLIDWV